MAASDNTFNEAMHKILQQLAVAGTLPDADLEFIATVQAAITQKLRDGASAGPGAAQAPMTAQGPPMMPPGAGGPMPGLVPSAPNMDEIRRTIGATGATQ